MYDKKIAEAPRAVAFECRREFARRINDLIVEQKDPVFQARDNRLHQDRIVVQCDAVKISAERNLIADRLRKIAARSRQRFQECASVQLPEIVESVLALMPCGTERAVASAQEEIVAAEGDDACLFK